MKAKNAIVGAKVKIKRSSKWYSYESLSNPKDTTGTITSFNLGADLERDFSTHVDWGNGYRNCYRLVDLKLVKE